MSTVFRGGTATLSATGLFFLGSAVILAACRREKSIASALPRVVTLTFWNLRQRILRRRLVEHNLLDPASIVLVGGVDISFVKGSDTDACAALVVIDIVTNKVVYEACKRIVLTAPYIPGYLAFREVSFLLQLLNELRATQPELLPGVILVDGNGILHPNRFGLACHLGVLSGIPTVGVGKSLHHVDGLTNHEMRRLATSCEHIGQHAELVGKSGAVWGALLRTTSPTKGVFKPVVVSVGHGLALSSAITLVWRTCKHRIPEPVRQADLRSREWLRTHGASL